MKAFAALSTVVFLFSGIAQAQVDTAAISERLNKSARQLGKDYVCLMQKDGKILYKKESQEFTAKTQQGIGATSQLLTAALVLTYVQEGKLSLDDKVAKYLPFLTKYSKGYITIRHCLTHQTGVESDGKLFQKNKYKTLEDEAMGIASRREIETNPGTEFKYSSIGYDLVGRVLEVIAKKPFDRIMQDRLLRPLGMRSSSFTNDDFNAAINPSFGGRSSANDLTSFMTMMLNKGMFNNKQVLTPESVTALLTFYATPGQMKNAPKGSEGFGFALGSWVVAPDNNDKIAVIAAPSFSGTWPMVDLCRGYTLVVLTKDLSTLPPNDLYLDLKNIVDEAIPAKCQ